MLLHSIELYWLDTNCWNGLTYWSNCYDLRLVSLNPTIAGLDQLSPGVLLFHRLYYSTTYSSGY